MRFFLSFIFISYSFLYAKVIAEIPEASGICFIQHSQTLIAVNDEGMIYELSTDGEILKEKLLGAYDFEGITYIENSNKLLLAVENDNSILVVDRENFSIIRTIKIKKKFQGIKLLKKSKNQGVEAITTYKNEVFLSNQSFKEWPQKNASVVFTINSTDKNKAKITQIFDHGFFDVAGLAFYKDNLYMLSDDADLLIEYDIHKSIILKTFSIPGQEQEGLSFDEENNLYIADDAGYIRKFTLQELGIQ